MTLGPSAISARKNLGEQKRRKFHFEELWATDEECRNIVFSSWSRGVYGNDILKRVMENLQLCAKEVDVWGFRK